MRCSIAYGLVFLAATPGYAGVEAVNVYEPRAFGYFIGDTLQRRVEVVTTDDTELYTSALPKPGPLTYWLDLLSLDQSVSESGGRKTYEIKLTYQTFYSALDPAKVEVPALPLKFSDGGQPASDAAAPSASIPAFQFLMSPLRDIVLQDLMPGQSTEIGEILRPDVEARTISLGPALKLLGMSSIVLVFSAAGLLRHYARWPFAQRQGRPFTIADRKISEVQESNGDDAYRDSLILLHRAFDDSAGRRIFAADVPDLIGNHQWFAEQAPLVLRFFESSRLFFFSQNRSAAQALLPIADIQKLASDLARQERAAA